MLDFDLTDRTALVTGASKGIGAATVRMLADQGARVVFCARGQDAVNALAGYKPPSGGGSVQGYVADMGDGASTADFLAAVDADVGGIDVLINNVGASPSRNFLHMSDADWEQLNQLNLMSAVRCTRHCLPHMRKQKWGRVVMIATGAAFAPGAALVDYAATKAAMIATAKALAGKYGADNILINSVIPGLIRTDMWERTAVEVGSARNIDPEAVFEANAKNVPVKRYGTAEEVATGIVFLCTEAANYINGSCLVIDGGLSSHV